MEESFFFRYNIVIDGFRHGLVDIPFVYRGQFSRLYNPAFLLPFAFCVDLYYLYIILLAGYIILLAWNRQLLP
ncbi:unnamed protein product [Camellia sinensis]